VDVRTLNLATAAGSVGTVRPVFVHETAIIEAGVSLGDGTHVWHHAQVREGAVIGRDCSLGKNVFVDQGVRIGDRVRIANNVSVYRGVTLSDDVFVGPSAVFTNDRRPRSHGYDWEETPTRVRRGASVGANATILCGIELGEWCMVGAGAVVTHDVADWQLVLGTPARSAGWCCWCGRVVSRANVRPADVVCDCGLRLGTTR
jgi:UDP-2-acetamido-3-amino-2,3-dideoxy-glucuronate N-acetyltransferase